MRPPFSYPLHDMAFPQIEHCLVCDDLRQEVGKKTSILGFFGIAPNVEILVQDLNQPLQRLSFLLVGGPGEGKFKVSVRLLDQEVHSTTREAEDLEISVPPGGKRSMFGFGFVPVKFPKVGVYRFVLLVDGQGHYEASFAVAQGRPEDCR